MPEPIRTLEQVEHALARIGHRLTRQRHWVMEVFLERVGEHLTAEDVCSLAEASGASVGQATVYRTLELGEAVGLLHRLDDPRGRTLYELNAQEPRLHHHLICLGCGRIRHFAEDLALGIEQVLLRERGFALCDRSLTLLGYCAECSGRPGDPEGPAPQAGGGEPTADEAMRVASERLSQLGYRLTDQRRAILAVLLSQPGRHWLPDEVYEAGAIDAPQLGIATVYRTLELFEKLGLVDSIEDTGGHQRFEPAAGSLRAPHHHLLCVHCGDIAEYRGNLIGCIALGLVGSGFTLAYRSLRLVGVCAACRAHVGSDAHARKRST